LVTLKPDCPLNNGVKLLGSRKKKKNESGKINRQIKKDVEKENLTKRLNHFFSLKSFVSTESTICCHNIRIIEKTSTRRRKIPSMRSNRKKDATPIPRTARPVI
jgi:hypothetical protein